MSDPWPEAAQQLARLTAQNLPLAPAAAQLAHSAISTQQRWEAISGGEQQQLELEACMLLPELLMLLLHAAGWEKIHEQPHSLQLLRAPQFHQLMLLLLAVHAQRLRELEPGNSASSASADTASSLPVPAFAVNASTSSSISSSGTSSCTSGSGLQTMQQHPMSSIEAAGRMQQQPYQLQLWQALGFPQPLLEVACGELVYMEPCEDIQGTCFVLSNCLEELFVDNINGIARHDQLSPSQMAVARLHQVVPLLLLETTAAFISNTSLVVKCADAAARSVRCWSVVLDEQLAKKTYVKGHRGSVALGASTVVAQLQQLAQELQQLALQLFKQLMQQLEAAGKLEPQQQQAKTASSSSQRIAEQQPPGGSTEVTRALTALVRVIESLLQLPVEVHLSWQGFSAVLQTYVRNPLSCRRSKDVDPTKQEVAIEVAAIEFNQVLASLCIQYWSKEPGQLVRAAATAAVGGAEQLQLFGLLLSTLKLSHSHILHHAGGREQVLRCAESMPYIHNIGLAAHHVLAGVAPTAAGAAAAGSSATGVKEVQPAVQPAAVPWLVLQARCLYLAGAVLRKQAAWKPTGWPDDPGGVGRANAGDAAECVINCIHACVSGAADVASRLATYVRSCCCPAPATESSSSEQAGNAGTCTSAAASTSGSRQHADVPAAQAGVLTAISAATPTAATPTAATAAAVAGPGTVGCDPLADVQQELLSLAEALLPGVACADSAFEGLKVLGQQPGPTRNLRVLNLLQQLQQGPGRLEELSDQLTAVGAALCTQLPTPCCCNNPGCTNMAVASEQQLVGGKSCICAGCQVARYCGKECQTAHWQQHKPVCRRIKKAAAVTGSGTL